nr:hypothetical protein GCM10010200_012180 [Actinomadura rugatobispora]
MRWTAVALAVAVLVAGGWVWFSAGSEPGPEPLPDGERSPGPVSFSERPLWEGVRLGLNKRTGVELRGGDAVVGDAEGRLAVVDAATGLPRWTLERGATLKGGGGAVYQAARTGSTAGGALGGTGRPVLAGTGDDWTVLVPYYVGDTFEAPREQGVAALSGRDGSVRWKRPIVRPGEDDGDALERLGGEIRPMAAGDRAVLAVARTASGDGLVTVALDAAGKRELWRRPGVWGLRFAGDVVLAEKYAGMSDTPAGLSETGPSEFGQVSLVALDAATGRDRWSLGSGHTSSQLMAATPTHAVVRTGSTVDGSGSLLVSTATGGVVHRLRAQVAGCADDGHGLIACSVRSGSLVTVRIAGGSGVPSMTGRRVLGAGAAKVSVDAVHGNRIFLSSLDEDDVHVGAVVDRAGNRLGDALPQPVAAVADGFLAFRTRVEGDTGRAEPNGLAIHRAAAGPVRPPGPDPSGAPEQGPLAVEARPLWQGKATLRSGSAGASELGLRSVARLRLVDETLVYSGRDARGGNGWRVGAADAATGRERWSVSVEGTLGAGLRLASADFEVAAGPGRERLLVVPYTDVSDGDARTRGENGVVALSPVDGKVRWKTAFSEKERAPTTVVASGRTVAAGSGHRSVYSRPDDVVTTVLDAATGRRAWSRPGHDPVGVAGGIVVVRKRGGGVAGLDAATGKPRWSRPGAEPLHLAGATAVIVRLPDGAAALDPSTGRELARTGAPLDRCEGGERLVACRAVAGSRPDGRVTASGRDRVPYAVAVRLAPGRAAFAALPWTAITGVTAHDDRLFVTWKKPTSYGPAGANSGDFLTADGAGRVVSDRLPGLPHLVGPRYVVVLDGYGLGDLSGTTSFAVHRRTA